MENKIVIVDYGMGNLFSVKKKLYRLKKDCIISSDPKMISQADKLILPGVGHFKKAMENMGSLKLIDALNHAVMINKKPVLGICLGMQIMADFSEEGNCKGLGWVSAEVKRFNIKDKLKHKVPHTGWNNIIMKKESLILKDVPKNSEFYFVHSYHLIAKNHEDILCETDYEYTFCSAIEKNNIFGVQFHPEKSHLSGEKLISNFLNII
jgi:glutamine amidotransferase